MIGFKDAVKMFFDRYTDFSGRSSRAEFWWVQLFLIIVALLFAIPVGIAMAMSGGEPGALVVITAIPIVLLALAIIIPSIALYVRRLHDINQTGWIYLALIVAGLIPIIGLLSSIAQIVIACIPGTKGPNKYGNDPYGNDIASTFS